MNAAIYLRISTDEQNLQSQRLEVLNYCRARGWEPVEFNDVISGGKTTRPGLDRLLAEIKAGAVKTVVVAKLDRLGRSLRHITQIIAMLEKQQVALVCTSQGIDTTNSNPMGRMQLGILAVFAEFEREMIRERTRAGLKAAVARGNILGRRSEKLVAVSQRAAIVLAWRTDGRVGGVRGLAVLLGGCSPTTAARVDREVPALVVLGTG